MFGGTILWLFQSFCRSFLVKKQSDVKIIEMIVSSYCRSPHRCDPIGQLDIAFLQKTGRTLFHAPIVLRNVDVKYVINISYKQKKASLK